MNLEQQAPALRLERSVLDAGRTAGVGRRFEWLAALALGVIADGEVARDEIDLFPMIVHEGRGGIDAGLEAQQPGATAHLSPLVEIARQDLLHDAGRIARGRRPARAHVKAMEFQVRLVHRHLSLAPIAPALYQLHKLWRASEEDEDETT